MNKEKDETLVNYLNRKVEKIMGELLKNNGIEVFGDLKVEIANMDTLALIKGSKIYMNIDAAKYPEYVLKYILAHELAHLLVKSHTKKFWEIVKRIYPQFEKGKSELLKRLKTKRIQ